MTCPEQLLLWFVALIAAAAVTFEWWFFAHVLRCDNCLERLARFFELLAKDRRRPPP